MKIVVKDGIKCVYLYSYYNALFQFTMEFERALIQIKYILNRLESDLNILNKLFCFINI